MPDRTYSDREVAAIIARAAQDQRLASSREDAPGLTLEEIQRAGHEAGLDPQALRRAADAVDAGTLAPDGFPLGTAVAERWVEGELRPGAWEDTVGHLRLALGGSAASAWSGPDVTTMGADVEWTHSTLSGVLTTVTLSPRAGQTRLRVSRADSNVSDARVYGLALAGAASILVGLLLGGVVAEELGLGDLAGILAVLTVTVLGTALGGPVITRRLRARRTRHAHDAETLADDLVRRLAREAGPPHLAAEAERPGVGGAVQGDVGAASRLDRSALDDAPSDPGARPRRRSRT